MSDATIHIRVPAITKARWVRESRAAKTRLGDWIVLAIEAQHPDYAYCSGDALQVRPVISAGKPAPGSQRTPVRKTSATLDADTIATLRTLGGGNLSRGIRIAALNAKKPAD